MKASFPVFDDADSIGYAKWFEDLKSTLKRKVGWRESNFVPNEDSPSAFYTA